MVVVKLGIAESESGSHSGLYSLPYGCSVESLNSSRECTRYVKVAGTYSCISAFNY